MDSWIKYFSDGTEEVGSDKLIKQKQASWTKGRQDNIVSVSISFDSQFLHFEKENSIWYQFDRFVFNGEAKKEFRVIQSIITPDDVGEEVCLSSFSYGKLHCYILAMSNDNNYVHFPYKYEIQEKDKLKFITAILKENSIEIVISDKGKYAGESIIKYS